MEKYDLNIISGIHEIMVTLQCSEYVGHIIKKVGGNCHGIDILNFDFENEDDFSDNDCNLKYHEDCDYFTAELKDENGNTLLIDGDAKDMNDMVVAVEILSYEPDMEEDDE